MPWATAHFSRLIDRVETGEEVVIARAGGGVAAMVADPAGQLSAERMQPLPIGLTPAGMSGLLDWAHGDPVDRMLAAQAIAEDATLIAADRAFAAPRESAGLRILWN